jgi:hypothetical protein
MVPLLLAKVNLKGKLNHYRLRRRIDEIVTQMVCNYPT